MQNTRLHMSLRDSDPPVVVLQGQADSSHTRGIQSFLTGIRERGISNAILDVTELSLTDHSLLSLIQRISDSFDELSISAPSDIAELAEMHGLGDLLCDARPGYYPENRTVWTMISFLLPARLDSCAVARRHIDHLASFLPFSEQQRMDIRLAAGEAVANAVRHGCRESEWKHITVRCSSDGESLIIEVGDTGPGFDPDAVLPPDVNTLPERGMGIHFMRETMDEVSYDFTEGTTVRLVKRSPSMCTC
jgi:anti-sigma regulatory factor (Ser/Thr protein kinase)